MAKVRARTLDRIMDNAHIAACLRQPIMIEEIDPVVAEYLEGEKTDLEKVDPRKLSMTDKVKILAQENVVVDIDTYDPLRKRSSLSVEQRVGQNRTGRVLGLVSHDESDSLSLLLLDRNIARPNLTDPLSDPDFNAPRNYAFSDDYGNLREGFGNIMLVQSPENVQRALGFGGEQQTSMVTVDRVYNEHLYLGFGFTKHLVNLAFDARFRYESAWHRKLAKGTARILARNRQKIPDDIHRPRWKTQEREEGIDQRVKIIDFRVRWPAPNFYNMRFPVVAMDSDGDKNAYFHENGETTADVLERVYEEKGWSEIIDIHRYAMRRSDLTHSIAAKAVRAETQLYRRAMMDRGFKGNMFGPYFGNEREDRFDMNVWQTTDDYEDIHGWRKANYKSRGPKTSWRQRAIGKVREVKVQYRFKEYTVKVHPAEVGREPKSAQILYIPA